MDAGVGGVGGVGESTGGVTGSIGGADSSGPSGADVSGFEAAVDKAVADSLANNGFGDVGKQPGSLSDQNHAEQEAATASMVAEPLLSQQINGVFDQRLTEQFQCMGMCHGFDGTPGEDATADLTNRVFGALQAVGGVAETGLGAALSPFAVGLPIMAHGLDNTQAGARSLGTGEHVKTFTEQGIAAITEELGASPETAESIGAYGDIGLSFLSIPATMLARTPGAARVLSRVEPTFDTATAGMPGGNVRFGTKIDFNVNRLPQAQQVAVNETLSHINAGTRPTNSVVARNWGTTFRNKYDDLPKIDAKGNEIAYKEYRVDAAPFGEIGAGSKRIVVGSDGRVYFTGTHYGDNAGKPFVRIK